MTQIMPYNAQKLPIEYKKDEELIKLLTEATEKYTEYKTLLKIFKFNSSMFLDALIKNESLRSSQIEGTQISHEDIYYLDYKEQNDDILEINNLKSVIYFAKNEIKNNHINLDLINKMHKILLQSGRGSNKNPGVIRTKQNYIGGTLGITFVPQEYEEIPNLLQNLFDFMNDKFTENVFINLAISHLQFETIHPYLDGNGRLGRALIPIQLAYLKNDEPILFLSEVIEMYKPTYYKTLSDSRSGNYLPFIKFFLQCIIEQCTANIYKINEVNEIYENDLKKVEENIHGVLVTKIFPYSLKKIVFSTKDILNDLNLQLTSANKVLNKLVKLSILIKEKKAGTNRITYRYKKIYEVFIGETDKDV